MPPKQQAKADLAKKQKMVEDKTFGLKNKNKSKNVQKYVHSLKQSVQPKPDPSKTAAKKKEEEEKAKDKELNLQTIDELRNFLLLLLDVCRHALPPGYVLKSQMKALLEEEAEKMPIEEEIENQRAKVKTSTPMTPELFMQWKKKKIAERDAGLASQMAERAKNDRMSGRELFLSDSSVFVDDAEASEKYQREQQSEVAEKKVNNNANGGGSSSSETADGDAKPTNVDDNVDDDDLDINELNELQASLSKVTIQEPGTSA